MNDQPAGNKSTIMGPVLAGAIAGIAGWVLTVSVRVSSNDILIRNTVDTYQQERQRVSTEINRLRQRVSTLEQQGSRLDERTRPSE